MKTLIKVNEIYSHIVLSLTLVVAISWGETFKKIVSEIPFLKKLRGPILQSVAITIVVVVILITIHTILINIFGSNSIDDDNK
tara:strand:+ start:2624 stop:2872 length:249 start_codon:yes stop_codon:yes gene_type:complete